MEYKAMDRFWENNYSGQWIKEGYLHGGDPLFRQVYNNSMRLRYRPALNYYGRIITWDELRNLILKAAGGLRKLGVKKGDRVYLGLANCPQFVISYYAAHSLGAVIMSISPAYKAGEVSYVVNDAQVKVMIIEESVMPVYEQIKNNIPTVEHVVVTALDEYIPEDPYPAFPADLKAGGADYPGTVAWKDLMAADPINQFEDVSGDDLALLQYTSGTTGRPKGAMLTHKGLVNGAWINSHICSLTVEDRFIVVLPMFHITAMNDLLNNPMYTGGELIILARFDVEAFLQAVERYKPTYTVIATPIVIMMANHPAFPKYDISSMRIVGIGGAALPVNVANKYQELGINLFEGYGMSETTATTTSNTTDVNLFGSIGMLCPNMDMRIADVKDLSRDVEIGEEGELWVRGDSNGIGYWGNPEASAETFLPGGWVRTGDIVKIDEKGFLYICGRLKEMIKVSAYSVFPAEVEEYMYAHPSIMECCAIGVPHDTKGEEVKLFVVLKPDYVGKVTEQELIDWSKDQMAPYKYPRIIEFRDSLPKGNTGKVQRKDLVEEEKARRANG
ncbi:MAG: AMP-binding protein [Syntrophomonadaceae bacterium]|nr:AMP-binding protein [Syntrophomonadaceae bacterium]